MMKCCSVLIKLPTLQPLLELLPLPPERKLTGPGGFPEILEIQRPTRFYSSTIFKLGEVNM